ncbi:UDP-N-acetylmuramoyl-L-alanine--D-glutamate ligase [Geosporobacter ferrireducens]|uniref:UDP-N-acetylmuramoylalanine--D-glutamate ligase n=1 Tax=Geosporobacter ferrireducens TaxID=1424294 RepID=A0A1D8GC31_9FIRM|nr:UDP-N-acetylmuramoyl-L-alanine--D-glutamate ligase [Geosporobacter ferrireducens]AOT68463.1 UDP-N-acetylmuramoylalanine--D-glutamate ligase [Geosporobacter ferrireducens]MTI53922.1 UDP-N-acetylmuramoyl-L-alanine--D-glutamate ligase [Geosporobacter ferrireducens]
MEIKNRNILVVGIATSGIPTVNTLLQLGAKITINDIKEEDQLKEVLEHIHTDQIQMILGHHPEKVSQYDFIVLSPGVPTDLPFLTEAREQGVPVIGELELAYQLCAGSFVAITGTNGKTTTTALTGEIFQNACKETYVVGNIGVAAISKSLEAGKNAVMVTEVSSFQLESIVDFKPHIAAVLNITPDHLNRHKTMENYIDAKSNIFRNQTAEDILVLNMDDEQAYKLKERANSHTIFFSRKQTLEEGAFIENGSIVVHKNGTKEHICKIEELRIPGAHNLENALAATVIAYWTGIDGKIIEETLRTFMGVEHRIEFVDEVSGILFINDSKGTNPDASIKAVEAVREPIILIAGGMDKGSSFESFIDAFQGKVKYMVLIGETANKMKETAVYMGFENCCIVKDMEEAVKLAYSTAKSGDTVLLSPACASWDMYQSYEQRGNHFKECVGRLRRSIE